MQIRQILKKAGSVATEQRIAWPVDSGEIYLTQDIAITPTDDLGTLRAKCQCSAVDLYLKFFSEPHRYLSNAVQNDTGRSYYFMNRLLKSRLVQRIQAGEMSRGDRRASRAATS